MSHASDLKNNMQPLTIPLGIQIHVVKQVESVCKCMHVAQRCSGAVVGAASSYH